MLDTYTKLCIDTVRDIFAGKVPAPSASWTAHHRPGPDHTHRLQDGSCRPPCRQVPAPDDPQPGDSRRVIPGAICGSLLALCGRIAPDRDDLTGFEIAYLTTSFSKIIGYQEGPQKKPPTRARTDHLTVPVGPYVRRGRPGFIWPVHIRRIYPPDFTFKDESFPPMKCCMNGTY